MLLYILSLLLSVAASIYFIIGMLIHIGLTKKYEKVDRKPHVTILVAVRNEEKNLPFCLESLGKQTYPADCLQIILLNDRSSDASRQILLNYTERFSYMRLIDITEDQNGLKGKMNVIAQGMDHVKGEIILITDADCRVPETWVSEMVTYFADSVGLVCSLTVIEHFVKKSELFGYIQTLDWLFLQTIAAGTAGINLPVSVLGNNYGFRKTAYDQIGGFRKIGFSLTEDMALLIAIAKYTTYEIVYPLNRRSMIQSLPLNHIHDFLQQRKRWLSGGLKAPLWGWVLMLTSFLVHLFIMINLLMFNFNIPVFCSLFLILGIDFSLLWRQMLKSGIIKIKRYFIAFEIFYIFYTIVLAIAIVFPGKIHWKERSFKTRG